jgi:hypothetical protein
MKNKDIVVGHEYRDVFGEICVVTKITDKLVYMKYIINDKAIKQQISKRLFKFAFRKV